MLQMSENFLEQEGYALTKDYGVGNRTLYNLCNTYKLPKMEKITYKEIKANKQKLKENFDKKEISGLAAQFWLIGRSYAASPDRRGYGAIKDPKIEYTISGNGLDDYFSHLALALFDKNFIITYEKIRDKIEEISEKKYEFDDDDYSLINEAISTVINLNRLLKEVRFALDEDDLKRYIKKHKNQYRKKYSTSNDEIIIQNVMNDFKQNNKNMLSFCSKFLHFHSPDSIFIMDSITKGHFKGYGNPYEFKFQKMTSKINFKKSQVNEILGKLELNIIIGDKELTDTEEEYKTHCVREYLLAKKIYQQDSSIFQGKYIPRLIDTYVLIANSDFSDNPELLD